ncbi:MAG: SEC-C domain-containing protein [Muribaculaceae bacterium]|nr:SEC-C domain-containing protein [Muribaculaceae bacterium]
MLKCPKCGFGRNPENAKFCGSCGSQIPASIEIREEHRPVIGRHEMCPCGSGKKYMNCHGRSRRTK